MTVEKAKQKKIPGFTEIEDDEVEEAAVAYREATDAWLAAQKPALELEKKLGTLVAKNKAILKACREHPKGKVRVGGVVLTIPPPTEMPKIKVKIIREESEAAE